MNAKTPRQIDDVITEKANQYQLSVPALHAAIKDALMTRVAGRIVDAMIEGEIEYSREHKELGKQ